MQGAMQGAVMLQLATQAEHTSHEYRTINRSAAGGAIDWLKRSKKRPNRKKEHAHLAELQSQAILQLA
jgi:hypothetical protein